MTDAVNITKLIAGGLAAGGAVPAAFEAIEKAERMILGVPQSVLLVAIVGALIGVLLLPEKDTDRITPDEGLVGRVARARQMAARIALLGLIVIAYAFVASWLIAVATNWMPSLTGAPQLPLAGISGVLIRRALPSLLKLVERRTGSKDA